jgi:hypothetical protein
MPWVIFKISPDGQNLLIRNKLQANRQSVCLKKGGNESKTCSKFQRSAVAQNRYCSWVRLSYDVQAQRENEEAERETERKLKDGWQVSNEHFSQEDSLKGQFHESFRSIFSLDTRSNKGF